MLLAFGKYTKCDNGILVFSEGDSSKYKPNLADVEKLKLIHLFDLISIWICLCTL